MVRQKERTVCMRDKIRRSMAVFLAAVTVLLAAFGPVPVGADIFQGSLSSGNLETDMEPENETKQTEAPKQEGGLERTGETETGRMFDTLSGNAAAESRGEAGTKESLEGTDATLSGSDLDDAPTLSGNRIEGDLVILAAEYDGVRVTVAGSREMIPEGSSLRVAALDSENLMLYATSIYDAEVAGNGHVAFDCLSGYDISILDADGNVVELGEDVQVTIENAVDPEDEMDGLSGNDAYEVYHVTDEEKAAFEKLDSELTEDGLAFATDSFSPYIVGRTTYGANDDFQADKPFLRSNGASGSKYFGYTGKVEIWTAPQDGLYSLEAIGGGFAGPDGSSYNRNDAMVCSMGYGGYSIAYVNLHKGDTLYIAVGGAGSKSTSYSSAAGGWNGGGTGTYHAGSGGGATSFASKLIGDGTLANYKNDMDSLVAVAGGAGGQNAAMDQKLSLVQMAAMSGLGGGEKLSNLYAKIMEDPTVAVYGASKDKYYAFGKGQDSVRAASIKGSLYAGGAGGGGVYGGFSSDFFDTVENGVKSTFGGTGGTGYINFASDSKIYALNDKTHNSYTRSEWLETGNRLDLVLGNGQAAINYLGKIKSSVTLNLGNDAVYNGQKGSVVLTGDAGSTIDLSGVTPVSRGDRVVGFNVISGDGKIAAKSKKFTFGEEDTVLIPLIYSSIDLVSVQKVGASEFKGYTYNNNVLLNWDEAGNNNKKTYYVHQSVDGGGWKQLTMSNYTQLTVPMTEFYYTGGAQRYTAPADGTYYVQLYGAQGGSDGSSVGGYGGYVYGYLTLKKGDVVTVNVGGGGRNSSEVNPGTLVVPGGWNGGGTCVWSGSGGGRTDIYVNGRLVAAAAGGGGATNGHRGHGARESSRSLSDVSSSWQGESKTSYGSTLGDDRNDAGAGGAGYARGGSYGMNENPKWGGGDGGHGGYNGYASGTFSLVTESGGNAGNGKNNSSYNGGLHGYAVIRPDVRFSVYQQKSHLSVTPDKAVPNKPFNGKVILTDGEKRTADISWSAPADNGTSYRHKVTAYEITGSNTVGATLGESNITTDNIVSGVAGYYYYSDTNATGTATKNHTYTVNPLAPGVTLQDKTTYLHVAAVDRAGNLGATYDIPINAFYSKSGSVTWVDNGNQYGLRPGQDTISLYKDGKLVERKTLDTKEDHASFTFDNLEYGHIYTVAQQDVSPYGVEQSDWDFVNTLLLHIHKDVRDDDGNDIDGGFVDTGDILEYVIELGQQSDQDRKITVFDQVPAEVEYISSKDQVTVVKTQAELEAYNAKAEADGYARIPESFNLDTPVVAYQYTGKSATSNTFSFFVKVRNTAETKHIVNQAMEYVNVAKPGEPEKLQEIPSNEVENIVRFNPLKAVSDLEGNDINKTSVSLGEVIIYTITFQNVGDEDETATVTDVLPYGLAFVDADNGGTYDETSRTVTWTVTAKPHVLQTVSFRAKVLVDGKDIYVRNTAKVDLNKKPKPTPETENLPMGDPEKDVYDSDGCDVDGDVVYAGETLTYTVTYVNDSDEARKYTVTDMLPEGVEAVEILDGGVLQEDGRTVVWTADVESKTKLSVSAKVKVLEAAKGGTLRNKATVRTVKPDDPDAVYKKETNEVENPVMPDPVKDVLSVSGTGIDKAVVYEGSKLVYTISYRNPSDKEKTFEITDLVPAGTEFVSAEGGTYNEETGLVTFERTLAGGETNTVTFTVSVLGEAKDTIIKNKATVTVKDSPDEQEKPDNPDKPDNPGDKPDDPKPPVDPDDPREIETNEVINPVMPDPVKDVLSTTGVSIDRAVVYEGSKLIYTVTYKNPADEEKTFEITDTVPDHTAFVSVGEDGSYKEETGLVTFIRKVAGHETDTVTFTVEVLGEAKDTTIRNTAFVAVKDRPGDQPDMPVDPDEPANPDKPVNPDNPENPDEPVPPSDPDDPDDSKKIETNEVINPVIPDPEKKVSTKTRYDIDGDLVYAGDELVFEISYKNPADETKNYTITDKVPEWTKFVSAENGGVYDEEAGLVTFKRTVKAGETDTVKFTVLVLDEGKDHEITNKAIVKALDRPLIKPDASPQDPPEPDDPQDVETNETEDPVMPDPVKTVTDQRGIDVNGYVVEPDSRLIYSISFKNPTKLTKTFTVTDKLPEGVEFIRADHDGVYDEKTHTVTYTMDLPGETSHTVTCSVRVKDAQSYTKLANTAEVITDAGKSGTNTVENETIVVPKKDICGADGKSINGSTVYWNKVVKYEITYTNYTDEPRDITIVDAIDGHLKKVGDQEDGGISDGGVFKDGVITWELKNVPARYTGKVTFSARTPVPASAVDIPNTAVVTLHGTDIKSMGSDGKKDKGDMEFTTNEVMIHVPARPDEEETPYGALEVEVIDEDTNELIPGNEVTVYDSDGNVIDQWISTTERHLVEHLENGSYLVCQTTVVDGYVIVVGEKIVEVNNNSGTVRVTLVDKKTDAQPAGHGMLRAIAPYTGDAGGGFIYLLICVGTLLLMLFVVYIYWKEQKKR